MSVYYVLLVTHVSLLCITSYSCQFINITRHSSVYYVLLVTRQFIMYY